MNEQEVMSLGGCDVWDDVIWLVDCDLIAFLKQIRSYRAFNVVTTVNLI